MSALPKLGLKKNVVGVLCLAENAVSDRAIHPMAIIKSYKVLPLSSFLPSNPRPGPDG